MQNDRLSRLLEFLENEAGDPFLLYAIATEYNSRGETAKALAFYERLLAEHPGYVGTYYHLGKLQEKTGVPEKALETYQQGMSRAREKRDMHALSELQGAYNQAAGLDYEDD